MQHKMLKLACAKKAYNFIKTYCIIKTYYYGAILEVAIKMCFKWALCF